VVALRPGPPERFWAAEADGSVGAIVDLDFQPCEVDSMKRLAAGSTALAWHGSEPLLAVGFPQGRLPFTGGRAGRQMHSADDRRRSPDRRTIHFLSWQGTGHYTLDGAD